MYFEVIKSEIQKYHLNLPLLSTLSSDEHLG